MSGSSAGPVEVIGEALLAGEGYRLVAERIGVPAETVRDWRRRFRSRADTVAAHFLRWAVMRFADEPAERVKSRQITRFAPDDPRGPSIVESGPFDQFLHDLSDRAKDRDELE